jgi:hypothetical protein
MVACRLIPAGAKEAALHDRIPGVGAYVDIRDLKGGFCGSGLSERRTRQKDDEADMREGSHHGSNLLSFLQRFRVSSTWCFADSIPSGLVGLGVP